MVYAIESFAEVIEGTECLKFHSKSESFKQNKIRLKQQQKPKHGFNNKKHGLSQLVCTLVGRYTYIIYPCYKYEDPSCYQEDPLLKKRTLLGKKPDNQFTQEKYDVLVNST
uniref:Uncharacterized protein n=1 Tax=Cacopsylla melanoneura TaxID=428564 RepID=A0A8D9AXR5_9HEMI